LGSIFRAKTAHTYDSSLIYGILSPKEVCWQSLCFQVS